MLTFLFAVSTTFATEPFNHRAQGVFHCIEKDTDLKQKKAAALQKTLSKTSFLIRPLANSRLQDKPDICKQYRISTKDTEMKVQCDDKTQITLMLDGTPTIYPTKDGPLSVIAQVKDNRITQTFQVSKGGLSVEYIFHEDRLQVIKTIDSSYLGTPLVVSVDYRPESKK